MLKWTDSVQPSADHKGEGDIKKREDESKHEPTSPPHLQILSHTLCLCHPSL